MPALGVRTLHTIMLDSTYELQNSLMYRLLYYIINTQLYYYLHYHNNLSKLLCVI